MKKKIVAVPTSESKLWDRMLETTRTVSYRKALLGKKEFSRRNRNAHRRTAGTRRAQVFVLKRLDALLAANKAARGAS